MLPHEAETVKKPTQHSIDFNLTVRDVIEEIRNKFPRGWVVGGGLEQF